MISTIHSIKVCRFRFFISTRNELIFFQVFVLFSDPIFRFHYKDIQHMDMQHRDCMQYRHAAGDEALSWECNKDIQHGDAVRTCSRYTV
jgi:hypothetical protein